MKHIIVIISTILSAFICGSCVPSHMVYGDTISYGLSFIFQDTEGNNLAEGIDLKDWIPSNEPQEQATGGEVADYKLDIILSKQSDKYDNENYHIIGLGAAEYDDYSPVLMYQRNNDKIFLGTRFGVYMDYVEPQEKLTYKITCPHIFGDNEIHVITTYWKQELGEIISHTYYPECYMVEFDGKAITDIGYDLEEKIYRRNYVTLTVNR